MKGKRQLEFRDSLKCLHSAMKDMDKEDLDRYGKEIWILIRLDKYKENLTKHNKVFKMNRDEEFEKWYDEYFGNAQGEDSPYTYNDVKIAFFKGFDIAKENFTKHNSRTFENGI